MEEFNYITFVKFIHSVNYLTNDQLEAACKKWYLYFDYKQYQAMARSAYRILKYGSPKKASDYYYNKKVVIRLILANRGIHPEWAKLENGYTACNIAFNDVTREFHDKTIKFYSKEELITVPYATDEHSLLTDEGFESFVDKSSQIPIEYYPLIVFQYTKYYKGRLHQTEINEKKNDRTYGSPKIDQAFCKSRLVAISKISDKKYGMK